MYILFLLDSQLRLISFSPQNTSGSHPVSQQTKSSLSNFSNFNLDDCNPPKTKDTFFFPFFKSFLIFFFT